MSIRAIALNSPDEAVTGRLETLGWEPVTPSPSSLPGSLLMVQQFRHPDDGDHALEIAGRIVPRDSMNLLSDADGWIVLPAPAHADIDVPIVSFDDLTAMISEAVSQAVASATATSERVDATPTPPAGPSGPQSPAPVPPAYTAAGAASGERLVPVDPGLLKLASRHPRASVRAWQQIESMDRDRTTAAYARTWAVSPELALLAMLPEEQRRSEAQDLLGLMRKNREEQVASARASVTLAHALKPHRVSSAQARAETLGFVRDMAGETVKHLRRWRKLSRWAPGLLIGSLVVAALLIWLVLSRISDEHIGSWAAVPLVFTLTIFAISPAVLLLVQRPLAGLDQWSPGGKSDSSSAESSDDGTAKPAPSAPDTPAGHTTAPSTT